MLINLATWFLIITYSVGQRQHYLGEECFFAPNDGDGLCIEVTNCTTALRAIRKEGFHNYTRCGFYNLTEVVCCPLNDVTDQPDQRDLIPLMTTTQRVLTARPNAKQSRATVTTDRTRTEVVNGQTVRLVPTERTEVSTDTILVFQQYCIFGSGSKGTCMDIVNCSEAIRSISQIGYHTLSRCGFRGSMEVVCCPRESGAASGNPTTELPRSTAATTVKVKTRSDLECDKLLDVVPAPSVTYITEGEDVTAGEFPYVVGLGYEDPKYRTLSFLCGGTLITQTHVLTAAHCCVPRGLDRPVLIRAGVVNITGQYYNSTTDYNVTLLRQYPEYTRKKYHDVCILTVNKEVPITETSYPVCLYTEDADPTVPVTALGWGTIEQYSGMFSEILQKATLSVVPLDECKQHYPPDRSLVNGLTNDLMCAGDASGRRDTCQGDSGGPLVGLTSKDSYHRLVGITSFGRLCGANVPGVYTKISRYIPWIERSVWSEA